MNKRHFTTPTSTSWPTSSVAEIEELCNVACGDDDNKIRMYQALRQLSTEDRRILCTYAEVRSYRKLATIVGMPATTLRRRIEKIRTIIKRKI